MVAELHTELARAKATQACARCDALERDLAAARQEHTAASRAVLDATSEAQALVALRDQMLARKTELMAQAKASGLPAAKPSVVNLIAA